MNAAKTLVLGLVFLAGTVATLFLAFLLRFDWHLNLGDNNWGSLYYLPALLIYLPAQLPSAFCLGIIVTRRATGRLRMGSALLLAVAVGWLGTVLFFMGVYADLLVADAMQTNSLVTSGFPRSVYMLDFWLTSAWAMLLVLLEAAFGRHGSAFLNPTR